MQRLSPPAKTDEKKSDPEKSNKLFDFGKKSLADKQYASAIQYLDQAIASADEKSDNILEMYSLCIRAHMQLKQFNEAENKILQMVRLTKYQHAPSLQLLVKFYDTFIPNNEKMQKYKSLIEANSEIKKELQIAILFDEDNKIVAAHEHIVKAMTLGVTREELAIEDMEIIKAILTKYEKHLAENNRYSETPDDLLNAGAINEEKGLLQAAFLKYSELIYRKPLLSIGYVARAFCYIRLNQPEDFEKDFAIAIWLDPAKASDYVASLAVLINTPEYIKLAPRLQLTHQTYLAIAAEFKRLKAFNPNISDATLLQIAKITCQALALAAIKKIDPEILTLLKQAQRMCRLHPVLNSIMAEMLLLTGDLENAKLIYFELQKIIDPEPSNHLRNTFYLGLLLGQQNDHSEALRYIFNAVNIDFNLNGLGELELQEVKDYFKKYETYQEQKHSEQTSIPDLLLNAQTKQKEGQLESALEDYHQIIRRNPRSSTAYAVRAKLHLELKKFDDAIEDATRAIWFTATKTDDNVHQSIVLDCLRIRRDAYLALNQERDDLPMSKGNHVALLQHLTPEQQFTETQAYLTKILALAKQQAPGADAHFSYDNFAKHITKRFSDILSQGEQKRSAQANLVMKQKLFDGFRTKAYELKEQKPLEAIKCFDQAITILRHANSGANNAKIEGTRFLADLFLERGKLYYRTGDLDKAEDDFSSFYHFKPERKNEVAEFKKEMAKLPGKMQAERDRQRHLQNLERKQAKKKAQEEAAKKAEEDARKQVEEAAEKQRLKKLAAEKEAARLKALEIDKQQAEQKRDEERRKIKAEKKHLKKAQKKAAADNAPKEQPANEPANSADVNAEKQADPDKKEQEKVAQEIRLAEEKVKQEEEKAVPDVIPVAELPQEQKISSAPNYIVIKTVNIPDSFRTPSDANSPSALEVMTILQDAGFQIYLFGSTSCNLFLGKELTSDFDFTTNATQDDLVRLFKGKGLLPNGSQRDLFNFNGHTKKPGAIDLGVSQTLNSENPNDSLHKEIMSRDFTRAAIPVRLNKTKTQLEVLGKHLDDYQDVKVGELNTLIPAVDSFKEPLRMLRAIHFAAKPQKLSQEIKDGINACKKYLNPDFKPDESLLKDPNFKMPNPGQLNFWLQELLFNNHRAMNSIHLVNFDIFNELFPDPLFKNHLFDCISWLANSLVVIQDALPHDLKGDDVLKTIYENLALSLGISVEDKPSWPISLFYFKLISSALQGMEIGAALAELPKIIDRNPLLKLTAEKNKDFIHLIKHELSYHSIEAARRKSYQKQRGGNSEEKNTNHNHRLFRAKAAAAPINNHAAGPASRRIPLLPMPSNT